MFSFDPELGLNTPGNEKSNSSLEKFPELSRKARKRIKMVNPEDIKDLSREQACRLLEENMLYQAELEVQNEQLIQAQQELEASSARYLDLFDMAPVGYCLLDQAGIIRSANLTLCFLLSLNREQLQGFPLPGFVHRDDRRKFFSFFSRLVREKRAGCVELRLVNNKGLSIWISTYGIHHNAGTDQNHYMISIVDISEKKKAEQERTHQERFFSRILSHLSEAALVTDENSRITFASLNSSEVLGFDHQEILRIGNISMILGNCLENLSPPRENIQCTTIDGQGRSRSLLINITRLPGELSFLGEILYSCRDITLRKKTDRLFNQTLERYRLIVENTNDGIRMLDKEARISFVNPAMASMLGCKPEEMLGNPVAHYLYPEDRPAFESSWQNRQKGKSGQYEIRMPHKKGHTIWAIVSSTPRFDDQGNFQGSFAVIKNITDLKQAEQALRDSEELFRTSFTDHAAVKLHIDPDSGRILKANKAAAEFYGWSRDEPTRMNIQQISTLPPEETALAMEKARTGKKFNFSFKHRRGDGSVRDVEIYSSLIRVKGKQLLYSIIHDVTSKKRLNRSWPIEKSFCPA
ncbi:MAG: PAS domain S-box protein [Desulfonatronovibrionaceae bacterium]